LLALLLLLALGAALWFWLRPPPAGLLGRNALAHTGAILLLGPRPPGSPGLEQTRTLLCSELAKPGWSCREDAFERTTPVGRVRFANLRARFGKDDDPTLWERPVEGLLACHIDSKLIPNTRFLGADDAASAAGAILEIARVLGEDHPKLAKRLELVFFDGEEAFADSITPLDGLYGSRHYAATHLRGDTKPRFAIVLDMIGHRNLSVRIPSDTPEPLRVALFDSARELGFARHFGTAQGPIIDDHVPLQLAGVPSIDVIGDFSRDSWWHTPKDNYHLLSAESLDISIRVTLEMLERLLKPK
jgi:glutaminyl-peptide cyclotransferase